MENLMDGVRVSTLLIIKRLTDEELRAFWECVQSGQDCKNEDWYHKVEFLWSGTEIRRGTKAALEQLVQERLG